MTPVSRREAENAICHLIGLPRTLDEWEQSVRNLSTARIVLCAKLEKELPRLWETTLRGYGGNAKRAREDFRHLLGSLALESDEIEAFLLRLAEQVNRHDDLAELSQLSCWPPHPEETPDDNQA